MAEYKLNTTPPDTLVIYCSDSRFRNATEDFIANELKPTNHTPIVVPGSIGHLMHQALLPKNFKVLKEQIELLVSHNSHIRKIVLINHQDCAGYQALYFKLRQIIDKTNLFQIQRNDLKEVSRIIQQVLRPHVEFQMYFVSITNSDKVNFEKII